MIGRFFRGFLICRYFFSRVLNFVVCVRVRVEELFIGIFFKGKEVNDCVKFFFGVVKRLGRIGMLRF